MYRWIDGWIGMDWMEGLRDEWIDEWMDGWMDGWKDRWLDGYMDV